jgi:hypothetical protein
LVALAQNYNLPGKDWSQGDFDGDGAVGFSDLVALAQNYNTTLPPAAPALPMATIEDQALVITGDLRPALAELQIPDLVRPRLGGLDTGVAFAREMRRGGYNARRAGGDAPAHAGRFHARAQRPHSAARGRQKKTSLRAMKVG